jgi:glycosyltransferase involved in cell wall biosynthesis
MTHERTVLCVVHTPTFGGPHNQLLRLNAALSARGWHIVAVLPNEDGDGLSRLQAGGVECVQLPWHRPRKKLNLKLQVEYLRSLWPEMARLRELAHSRGVAVIQVCGLLNLHSGIAAHWAGYPLVWQLLGTFAPPPIRMALMPIVLSTADVVMTTGKKVARAHPGTERLGARWVSFLPPVDTNAFAPSPERRSAARAELEIPEDGVVIGTVGNRCWVKNHEAFVELARLVTTRYPNAYFRVLGSVVPSQTEYYERAVVQRARELGLIQSGHLRIISPGSRVCELLPALDIFALTSRAEGVPTAILEAMASGIPVVSTSVGSVTEVVASGRTGFSVKPGDVDAMANATSTLISDVSLRLNMGTVARQTATNEFGIEVCAEAHCCAFETALSHRTAPPSRTWRPIRST